MLKHESRVVQPKIVIHLKLVPNLIIIHASNRKKIRCTLLVRSSIRLTASVLFEMDSQLSGIATVGMDAQKLIDKTSLLN